MPLLEDISLNNFIQVKFAVRAVPQTTTCELFVGMMCKLTKRENASGMLYLILPFEEIYISYRSGGNTRSCILYFPLLEHSYQSGS